LIVYVPAVGAVPYLAVVERVIEVADATVTCATYTELTLIQSPTVTAPAPTTVNTDVPSHTADADV
jgi:hypothetical protein